MAPTLIDPEILGLEVDYVHANGEEVRVYCPYHDDKNSSADFNMVSGLFHCFSCGAGANAKAIASEMGGEVSYTAGVPTHLKRRVEGITDLRLDWFNSLPRAHGSEYLRARGVDSYAINFFDIRQDKDAVVFPFHGGDWNIFGWQMRKTFETGGPRYITRVSNKRNFVMWPENRLQDGYVLSDPLFIVEGIFGVLRLWRKGHQAITFLGSSKVPQFLSMLISGFDAYVFYDDDNPGYKGAIRLVKASRGELKAILPGAEVDELSDFALENFMEFSEVTNSISEIRKYMI